MLKLYIHFRRWLRGPATSWRQADEHGELWVVRWSGDVQSLARTAMRKKPQEASRLEMHFESPKRWSVYYPLGYTAAGTITFT